jgi:aryl-alcohol dehydrogenase-like predicted oxidoreductase
MERRMVERLDRGVNVVGLGTWQLGADWGTVDADAAHSVLEEAVERSITFFDTGRLWRRPQRALLCRAARAWSTF